MTRKIHRVAAVFFGIVLAMWLGAQPAWAAPSYTACPTGYRCFWEHANFQGAKSMYNNYGTCSTFPHGTGFVGDKVSSMWNRQSRRVYLYQAWYCASGHQLGVDPGHGYSDFGGSWFNDDFSSAKTA